MGNHVTLIAGFRTDPPKFWTREDQRIGLLQAEFRDLLDVVYTSNDGTFGIQEIVTGPLAEMLEAAKNGAGRPLGEVLTIGPPLMMRAVSDLTKPYGAPTVASLDSIMVDATGMCGACMVPVMQEGSLVRKHACIDGPEIDFHIIDWDKFRPDPQFKAQEDRNRRRHGRAYAQQRTRLSPRARPVRTCRAVSCSPETVFHSRFLIGRFPIPPPASQTRTLTSGFVNGNLAGTRIRSEYRREMSASILSLSAFKADASRLLDKIHAEPTTLVLTKNGRVRRGRGLRATSGAAAGVGDAEAHGAGRARCRGRRSRAAGTGLRRPPTPDIRE